MSEAYRLSQAEVEAHTQKSDAASKKRRAEEAAKKKKVNAAKLAAAGVVLASAIGTGMIEGFDNSTTLPNPSRTPDRVSTPKPAVSEADKAKADAADRAQEAKIRESLKPNNNELGE
jgi:hypothetical protein